MVAPLLAFAGSIQGRITPTHATPVAGSWVLCLGADLPEHRAWLAANDRVDLSQTADVTGIALTRFKALVRGPREALPTGASWVLTWSVAGVVVGTRTLGVRQLVTLTTPILPSTLLAGNAALAFRLQLLGLADPAEVEVPAVYLDALETFASAGPRVQLVNLTPDRSETQVPRASIVELHLLDAANPTTGFTLAATQVYINGQLAYDAGAFQAGWQGASSAAAHIAGNSLLRIRLHKESAFGSAEVVSVRVVSTTATNPVDIDETYSFTTADETAPAIVQATARDLYTVRVAFNEPMAQVDSSSATDVLNTLLWTLARVTVPSYLPELVEVRTVNPDVVDLVFAEELSPGQTYTVSVIDAEDLFNNAIGGSNSATFVAASPQAPAERSLVLFDRLPLYNRRLDEQGTGDLGKFLACLQEPINLLLADIDGLADAIDPDHAPEAFVDAMLADLGNPFSFELALVDKRRLVQLLVPLYRKKGTNPGITSAVRLFLAIPDLIVEVVLATGDGFLLGDAELGEDWELGSGDPFLKYSFRVRVNVVLTDEQRANVRAIVVYMKPAHTHFLGIIEPTSLGVIDHVELGLSELGDEFILH